MRIKILISLLFLSIFSFAHEFWLQPDKFKVAVNETFNLSLKVGEGFQGEKWAAKAERLQDVKIHGKSVSDVTKRFLADTLASTSLSVPSAGSYVIAMTSKPSFIELEGEKFTDYLIEDGLQNVIELREKNGISDMKAREFYSRYAKTLIQVGDKTDNSFKKKIGFPIEIIPQTHPYAINSESTLQVLILFNGKPLPNNMVKVWHKNSDAMVEPLNLITDQNGMVSITITPDGQWMFSTVRMQEYKDKSKADYESFWGSYTFGYN